MRLQVVDKVRLPEIAFVTNFAGILCKTLLTIGFVVNELHVALVENSTPELDIANVASVDLIHMAFDMTGAGRGGFVGFVAVRTGVGSDVGVASHMSFEVALILAALSAQLAGEYYQSGDVFQMLKQARLPEEASVTVVALESFGFASSCVRASRRQSRTAFCRSYKRSLSLETLRAGSGGGDFQTRASEYQRTLESRRGR